MSEHASDCALNNAPAAAPKPCTCGASKRFKVFDYDIVTDGYSFVTHCRETLIASCGRALGAYWRIGNHEVSTGLMVHRAALCGFTLGEACALDECYRGLVAFNALICGQRGLLDTLVNEDLSPLTEDERAGIRVPATVDEFKAEFLRWAPWWEEARARQFRDGANV